MRIWHKDLIAVLPRKQLVAQWRECCLIAKNIRENGTPNHILVNKVTEYSDSHLFEYGLLIRYEIERRGYKCDFQRLLKWFEKSKGLKHIPYFSVFAGWHNDRYFTQCYYNLEEKYDCGGITQDEWNLIKNLHQNID